MYNRISSFDEIVNNTEYRLSINNCFPHLVQLYKKYIDFYYGIFGKSVLLKRCEELKRKIPPKQMILLKEISMLLKIDIEEYILINLLGDIARPTGCSTILHKAKNGKLFLGHNLDWPDYGISHKITSLTKFKTNDEYIVIPGFAGLYSISMGINSKGVGIFLHDSYTKKVYNESDCYPIGLTLAKLIENANSAEEIIYNLEKLKFTYGTMFFAIDRERAFLLEHAIDNTYIKEVSNGETICRTNHFIDIGIDNSYEESSDRLKNLNFACSIIENNYDVTIDQIFKIITSDGVFKALNEDNVNAMVACSIHSIVYEPQKNLILSSFITDFPAEKPNDPALINLNEL